MNKHRNKKHNYVESNNNFRLTQKVYRFNSTRLLATFLYCYYLKLLLNLLYYSSKNIDSKTK